MVNRIITERAQGYGWQKIATALSNDGIPTPTGNRGWTKTTIIGIVQAEYPLGIYVQDKERDIRVYDAWPPMVGRDVWDAAQMVKGKRDDSRQHHDRLFAGKARCANCRKTLKRTLNNQRGTYHVSYGGLNRACPGRSPSALTLWTAT